MQSLVLYTDRPRDIPRLKAVLAGAFTIDVHTADDLADHAPGETTIFDLDLSDAVRLARIKTWLATRPADGKAIFAIDPASHLASVRAYAIGATHVVPRPISRRKIMACFNGPAAQAATAAKPIATEGASAGHADIAAGLQTLDDAFARVRTGQALDAPTLLAAGKRIVTQIADVGLMRWMDEVRQHHGQTYQHCLLVTGVAVAFGQHLGFSEKDCMRLSLAGMMHDIGKARIPLEILEKPSSLDYAEILVMRRHPQLGSELLAAQRDIPAEVRDVVLHHHEFLDGSGYPDGLAGAQIADLVRIMTIADIFGALAERRPYKAPMPGAKAYEILQGMGPKLDRDLTREFAAVATAA